MRTTTAAARPPWGHPPRARGRPNGRLNVPCICGNPPPPLPNKPHASPSYLSLKNSEVLEELKASRAHCRTKYRIVRFVVFVCF